MRGREDPRMPRKEEGRELRCPLTAAGDEEKEEERKRVSDLCRNR